MRTAHDGRKRTACAVDLVRGRCWAVSDQSSQTQRLAWDRQAGGAREWAPQRAKVVSRCDGESNASFGTKTESGAAEEPGSGMKFWETGASRSLPPDLQWHFLVEDVSIGAGDAGTCWQQLWRAGSVGVPLAASAEQQKKSGCMSSGSKKVVRTREAMIRTGDLPCEGNIGLRIPVATCFSDRGFRWKFRRLSKGAS